MGIDIGRNKRAVLKKMLDKFTTFSWDGLDSFENFGAFITNNKDLKFYNGPSFSNAYTQPQFESHAGYLTGVSFQVQQISFNIGVYAVDDETYRKLIYWLNPLKISYLVFSFNTDYRYNLKLSKVSETSTRSIIGYDGQVPLYYTELSLTFDVIGKPCAIGTSMYEWNKDNNNDNNYTTLTVNTTSVDYVPTDISTPIDAYLSITKLQPNLYVKMDAVYNQDTVVNLFYVQLQNLSPSQPNLRLHYNSENGLLFLQYASTHERLLNLMNLTDTGEKIVSSFKSSKFQIPGRFDNNEFDINNFSLRVYITYKEPEADTQISLINVSGENQYDITVYPRTNLI